MKREPYLPDYTMFQRLAGTLWLTRYAPTIDPVRDHRPTAAGDAVGAAILFLFFLGLWVMTP